MNDKVNTGLFKTGQYGIAVLVLAMTFANPATAQTLAEEYNAILNGPNGVAATCARVAPNEPSCDQYNITPTTDLQMRFAAPEEVAAQKSIVKEYSAQQLKSVTGRLGALRMQTAAARGKATSEEARLAFGDFNALGGGAAADSGINPSPFSMYATLSHGFGSRDQTAYEDEADYTGNDLIVGGDFRVGGAFVVGVSLGYADKEIELSSNYSDASTPVTINAAGTTEGDGLSATVYGQWESDSFYANASLGGQWLDYDMTRRADYVTGAPPVALTATASTGSDGIQGSASIGYVLSFGGTSIDAALNGQYQKVNTDGFTETGALCTTGACSGANLNLRFAEQEVKSFETSLSVRAQHAFTTGFAVIVPFVSGEVIQQQEDDRYVISGMYAPLYGIIPNFNLNTDELDTEYYAAAVGVSFVRQGGWQGFLRYRTTLELENVSDDVIAAGLRWEF